MKASMASRFDYANVDVSDFVTVGQFLMNITLKARNGNHPLAQSQFGESFASTFGVNPHLCLRIWEHCDFAAPFKPKHLLWTLYYLRHYPTVRMACVFLGVADRTLKRYTWLVIKQIASKLYTLVVWERRNLGQVDHSCRITVDGTDFQIEEPTPFNKKWYSHKFRGPGLRYEVGISIQRGDIVWINGPFPCGSHPDLKIFRLGLKNYLDDGEMIEADRGYRGDECVRTSDDFVSMAEKRAKGIARARHETINGRFKNWKILEQRFRHDRNLHKYVFKAIVAITQIQINAGNRPFHVTY